MTDTSKEAIADAIEAAEQRGYARAVEDAAKVVEILDGQCVDPHVKVWATNRSEAIRALSPTPQVEDDALRCAECDCEAGGTDCNWIKQPITPTPPAPVTVSSAVAASVLLKDSRVTTMFFDSMLKGYSAPRSYADADAWVCDTLRALAEQEGE